MPLGSSPTQEDAPVYDQPRQAEGDHEKARGMHVPRFPPSAVEHEDDAPRQSAAGACVLAYKSPQYTMGTFQADKHGMLLIRPHEKTEQNDRGEE